MRLLFGTHAFRPPVHVHEPLNFVATSQTENACVPFFERVRSAPGLKRIAYAPMIGDFFTEAAAILSAMIAVTG